jgi:PLP dependent protein
MPFPDLADRVREVRERIAAATQRGGHGQSVRIIAVTKTHGPDAVVAAVDVGIGDVGENRVQEALGKMDVTTVPVRWHLIGHVQRNKVKAVSRFDLTHSLDSLRLAEAVNELGRSAERPIPVLAQVNVVGEESKGGFSLGELGYAAERLASLDGLEVRGVMTMAPIGADDSVLRTTFRGARAALALLRAAGHHATELSMGMSSDYEVAVEEGATCVRLGSVLFGARPA